MQSSMLRLYINSIIKINTRSVSSLVHRSSGNCLCKRSFRPFTARPIGPVFKRCLSTSAEEIRSDRVLTAKELRKVLKAYVGGARHYGDSETEQSSRLVVDVKPVLSQDELEPR